MGLSCSCQGWEGDGWAYTPPDDLCSLETKRARRCKSCGCLIKPGEECIKFLRFRAPSTAVEYKIYGDGGQVDIAPWFQCAKCGEQYLNLSALGYCIGPEENTLSLLAEYRAMQEERRAAA